MPLYEYRCEECGTFDQWRTISQCNEPAFCPQCEKTAQRIFSPPMLLSGSLRFKKESKEPSLVQKEIIPKSPKVKEHSGGRPWMLGH